jgi:hypothetical protein
MYSSFNQEHDSDFMPLFSSTPTLPNFLKIYYLPCNLLRFCPVFWWRDNTRILGKIASVYKKANKSSENVAKLKYLSMTVYKKSFILGEIVSFLLISKHIKIRIHNAVILPVVLYGSESWSLILRGEERLRVFENSTPISRRMDRIKRTSSQWKVPQYIRLNP